VYSNELIPIKFSKLNKMKYYSIMLVLAVAATLVFSSCGSEKSVKTTAGFELIFHEKNDGPKAQVGEWLYFRYTERRNQEVIFSLPSNLPDQKFQVPNDLSTDLSMRRHVVEALTLMSPGDSATIIMPYSEEFSSLMKWGEGDTSFFDLRLVAIKSQEEYQLDMEEERKVMMEMQAKNQEKADKIGEQLNDYIKSYKNNKLENIKNFPSGLKMYIIEEGDGSMAAQGNQVIVDYYGMLMDGTTFDNSISRGSPFEFPLGRQQVIAGWDEALSNVKVGTKAVIFLPPNLAYGPNGAPPTIPPNAELAFYIDFQGIQK